MTKNELYKKWIEAFASDIPQKIIQKYVKSTGNFIWHVFSWRLLNDDQYLIKNEAKQAYNKINKKDAIFINWFEDKDTKDITCDMYEANALDDYIEIYVVGRDFKWTYIKTHEDMCGPYFMKK